MRNLQDQVKKHSAVKNCSDISLFEKKILFKGRLSYDLYVECFSQLSFDSEMYTKSAAVADFVYTSESNESCEKHSTQR